VTAPINTGRKSPATPEISRLKPIDLASIFLGFSTRMQRHEYASGKICQRVLSAYGRKSLMAMAFVSFAPFDGFLFWFCTIFGFCAL